MSHWKAALLLLALACTWAFGATAVQGFFVSDGVTGRAGTPHGWQEEKLYVGQLGVGWGAGGTTLHTPAGWYRVPQVTPPGSFPGGRYALFSLKYDGVPAFTFRTNLELPDDPVVIDNQELRSPAHYSVMYNQNYTEWAPEPWVWGTDFYQTFVATHPHVTRIATKLAGKAGDHYWLLLNFAIYEPNGGPPSTWTRISPIRSFYLPGTMDPIIHICWGPYRSNEVDLVPGQTYAVRFWRDPSSQSESFAIVARPDAGDGYAAGHLYVGDVPYTDWDAYGYVSGGEEFTVVNHTPVLDLQQTSLAGWSQTFGQTFQATGTGLAAVEAIYTTGDASPPILEATFQVYDSVGGNPIGPPKTCYGVPGFYQARIAAFWEMGEVPLQYGQTYYVEWSVPPGGCNTWLTNEDLPGEAYVGGVSQAPRDLLLCIAEYMQPDPMIKLNITEIERSMKQGDTLSPDTFTVRNTGGGTLEYTITDDADWLSVDPPSGTSTGETDTITVLYSPSELEGGVHTATITVSDPEAINDPQQITVTLTVEPAPETPPGHYKVGWNMTGVPVDPFNPDAGSVFADLADLGNVITNSVFRYDPGIGYAVYPSTFTAVELGRGYWLKVTVADENTVVAVPGEDATSDQTVQLAEGWNMIGHTFLHPQYLEDLEVTQGASTLSWDDAVAAGWVAETLYHYSPGEGYALVRTDGTGQDDMLRPWCGYWVRAYVPCTLTFPYRLGAVGGTVRDSSLVPIEGATVTAGEYETTSGPGGVYSIPDVLPGTYAMTATAIGYRPQTVADVEVISGRTTTQDFVLEPYVNLLTNPGFETGSTSGWSPILGGMGIETGPWFADIMPHSGTYFAGIARNGVVTENGGLYQQVAATPGAVYTASVWSNLYWILGAHTGTRNRIGIDPYGGTDYQSSNVVWSDWDYQPEQYVQEWHYLTVSAEAQSSTITVFLHFQQVLQGGDEWHINCFDDAMLYEE